MQRSFEGHGYVIAMSLDTDRNIGSNGFGTCVQVAVAANGDGPVGLIDSEAMARALVSMVALRGKQEGRQVRLRIMAVAMSWPRATARR